MVHRQIEGELRQALAHFPAVALVGPKQVGKTTLAKKLIKDYPNKTVRYFDLERLTDYLRLKEDPEFFLEQFQNELVIIDEIQRLPELFAELRSLIDRHRIPGRFLLLGSASLLLMKKTADSLAGRIAYLYLEPFSLSEIGLQEQNCAFSKQHKSNQLVKFSERRPLTGSGNLLYSLQSDLGIRITKWFGYIYRSEAVREKNFTLCPSASFSNT